MEEAQALPVAGKRKLSAGEKLYRASQWQLMFWKLRRHKLAMIGGALVLVLYAVALFAPVIAPYVPDHRSDYNFLPPRAIHLIEPGHGLHPFVYGIEKKRNPDTFALTFTDNPAKKYYLQWFYTGDKYKLWGFIPTNVHLFGAPGEKKDAPTIFLFGTDELGRDVFSRSIMAAEISLSIGLVGVLLTFVLGVTIGTLSGYYGGVLDTVTQQIITFLISLPTIPIWMGLSAAIPAKWPPLQIYLGITVVLSLISWTGLARVIRGMMLKLREETFVTAARLAGTSNREIMFGHLLPSCMSYMIVNITLAVPGMILGETALSFLGLGLREPVVSWGVLLQAAQNVKVVALYPWMLIPALFVIAATLAFNFLGDGLRDAADPYA
jgi:peptide/nickel transport system permease protein